MKKTISNTDGFTLIEALVSLVVLTIGILGVAMLQASSTNQNTLASHTTQATTAAMDQIEQILSLPADDPLLDPTLDAVNFNRLGIAGNVTAANSTIGTVVHDGSDSDHARADFQVTTEDGYNIFFDGIGVNDPSNPLIRVAIDYDVYVVWNEGTALKTVAMNFTRLLEQ